MTRNSRTSEEMLDAPAASLTKAAREKLRQTVAKIEKLEEEKREAGLHIKDAYAEAKAMGYDAKALKAAIRLRRQDRKQREEQQAILDVYLHALGEI